LDSPHFPERGTIAQYSRATHFDCGQDRLTAQVEYVEMMERKAVQVFYPADHANGDAPCNEPLLSYTDPFYSIFVIICSRSNSTRRTSLASKLLSIWNCSSSAIFLPRAQIRCPCGVSVASNVRLFSGCVDRRIHPRSSVAIKRAWIVCGLTWRTRASWAPLMPGSLTRAVSTCN
jgi:hypothetical protein